MAEKRLSEMRNLGPVSERQLIEADICTPEDLRALGAVAAWQQLRFVFGRRISRNFLYAIEGALRGCDWRQLPADVKTELNRQIETGM